MATLKDLIVYGQSNLIGPTVCSSIYAASGADRAANKYFATDGTIQTASGGSENRAIMVNGTQVVRQATDSGDIIIGSVGSNISVATPTAGTITIAANGYTYSSGTKSIKINDATSATGTDSFAAGLGTTASGINQMVIGRHNLPDSTSLYAFIVGGGSAAAPSNIVTVDWEGNLYCKTGNQVTSDIRKKNIVGDLPLDKCYEMLDICQTVIYTLKDDETNKEQIGVIAQEVEEFFPEIVKTDPEGFKSLDYARLSVICLRVLKDVIKRLETLENKQ